jgi:hypothetical protein
MRKLAIVSLVAVLSAAGLSANHAWGNYHWARASNPLVLTVVNSTTADWDPYVSQAIGDWNASSVLALTEDPNGSTSTQVRRQCSAQTGQILVCNLAYGNNGWLGLAGISVDSGGHITRGYTKLNDTYFSTAYYNNFAWRQSVTCQEIGHDLGLDHQDEDFGNQSLFSCMDYQDPPHPIPNAHDYDQLATIYAHLDGGGGGGGSCNAPPGKGCNKPGVGQGVADPPGWGISVGRRGQKETFIRIDPDGTRHVTFVTWAQGF